MSAAGYTSVYLVVNMAQFMTDDTRLKFEGVRGTEKLARVIKHDWAKMLATPQSAFKCQEQFTTEIRKNRSESRMNIDEVAFATGIFKGVVLRQYSSPFYQVDKSKFHFPAELMENFQFKSLFLENWDRWDIHIRPSMTGMFIIRLTDYYDHHYGTNTAEFRTIASNVQSLQSSFDIPSALERRQELIREVNMGSSEAADKLKTIDSLIDWLAADDSLVSYLDYPRVQWQLAQEVCTRFINTIQNSIRISGEDELSFSRPRKNITTSLNDSFVVYHFNELYAPARIVEKKHWSKQKWKDNKEMMLTLKYNDLTDSPKVRESISQLIEGALLKKPSKNQNENSSIDSRRFPDQNQLIVDQIFETNFSTWNDELCLLTPRCCVVWPSRSAKNEYLYISSLPTTTSQVKYLWYWEAMERMIEFVVEIKLLSSLLEQESVLALNRFSATLSQMRHGLLNGNGEFDLKREEMLDLTNDAANLSRLVGLCRGLSTPQTWSRAEYASRKAAFFMRQLNIPDLIDHAETNVDNMTNLINHQDELYLASLSKKGNDQSRRLSVWFFIVSIIFSFILLVYSLPSFWVDALGLFADEVGGIRGDEQFSYLNDAIVQRTLFVGNLLPFLLIPGSIILYILFRRSNRS
ncbi:MAG: hypothetical protein AAGD96_08500 [Chloroflexota bacterium]